MRLVDEYRNPDLVLRVAEAIRRTVTRPWVIMEVCGGQTHAIVRFGLDELLPAELELVHGPGCPVCVTPVGMLTRATRLAALPGVIFCSFGDMLRVPGQEGTLLEARAAGADVRVVYTPADALRIARDNPGKEVVFFAVGFETTAPATAWVVAAAARRKIGNFSLLVSHVLVPPAMEAILDSPENRVRGFLAAGHVCAVMGYREYEPIACRYHVPIVVTGFEPLDILSGLLLCVRQLETGRAEVENQYTRSVRRTGNREALRLLREVFTVAPRSWRGLGTLPESGLTLAPAYARFDASSRFDLHDDAVRESPECRSGLILRGIEKPPDCPAFGTLCTPDAPLGAPMVSSEGACAAYYRYRRPAYAPTCPVSVTWKDAP